ncbi:MAG TPA: 16S rRNA (adenine(1518)-N(6)/adenine(1519)-N(6))-dimethyltransferase RsmA [Chlamydiales bacterium]|nr:16S rRNA (adenine(1518)-N(6)/adenine(1519)-N(6))-dimethyltransferase RsmA [Chlamydiales bacterium]
MSTLSELLLFLERIGRRPNKSLSQNFLIDPNIVRKIVDLAAIQSDSVLEIGPGAGALTEELLKRNVHLFAVEKDPILADELKKKFDKLTIFPCDILKFDLSSLCSYAPLKVVANLPYHITTPILEKLLCERDLFSSFTVMMQEEVAQRIQAKPGSKEFSSLSLFLQFHTAIQGSFKVSPSCFYPRPKVSSRVLHFSLKPPPIQEEAQLFSLIRKAFQMRRKMIRTSLQSFAPQEKITEALVAAKVSPNARPEELSLEQWIIVFQKLCDFLF